MRGDRIVAVGTEARRPRARRARRRGDRRRAASSPGSRTPTSTRAFAGRNLSPREPRRPARRRGATSTRIRTYAEQHPDCRGSWAAAGTTRSSATDGPAPRDLDAVVPDRPVFLMNTDTHAAWVNSRALELGRHHRGDARSVATATTCATRTARRRDACRREPPTRSGPTSCPADTVDGWRRFDRGRPARTCTRSGSPASRTRGSRRTCCAPTARSTTRAS